MNNVKASDIVEVLQNFSPYIHGLCRKFFLVGGTSEDLYEEGVIGLIEACKDYNGESLFEPRFEAFAKLCIRRQILDAIEKANRNKNKALNEAVSFMFADGVMSSSIKFNVPIIISSKAVLVNTDKYGKKRLKRAAFVL